MAATTANVAWPIQANSPSIPSFRKSLVPKNDFNVYKSLITQDKGSYINRMHIPIPIPTNRHNKFFVSI